jgi:Pb-reticulocyte binding protein
LGRIEKNLKPDEVVYQYVLTETAMVSILVTDKWIDIRTKFFSAEGDTPYSGMKKYGQIIESNMSSDDEIKYYSSVITDVVAEHLCEYVFNHKTKSVYVIPDISKSIFPIAAVQYKGIYLIDEVEEIANFIDYVQLINSLNTELDDIKIVNKVFGKREETSIHHINKWLEEHIMDNVVSITDCSDDLQAVSMECKKGKNTLIVYGHGVREPASELTEGAQSIEGAKSMIQIREVLKEVCISNFILISCVGGTPNSNNPEISSGTWTSIFERFNGNIMTCRWSVPTRDTISMMDKIYDNLLNKKMRFGEALVKAQRDMKNSGKNQLSWAGIECWIN